jgi:hypothetical protein
VRARLATARARRYRTAVGALADLPIFGNESRCRQCGAATLIRVHFCRCDPYEGRDHFHRICTGCTHEWVERCSDDAYVE